MLQPVHPVTSLIAGFFTGSLAAPSAGHCDHLTVGWLLSGQFAESIDTTNDLAKNLASNLREPSNWTKWPADDSLAQ